ncbi:MAG: hypothetical protein HUU46_20345 [Candidatus Hydrogenedentes bacterium]|nr:hypothetical protein [Candidatus Hydrogenedentota bacterium]
MTSQSSTKSIVRDAAWVIALSICVYALTRIPYNSAVRNAPAGAVSIGQVAVADDVNSYFSFMRQAAQGHFVFRNTMTYIDHDPVFVNLEFWFFGALMGWFGWAPPHLYDVWRIAGIATLLSGFAALARVALATEFQRRVALLMCAFGGGFGWLLVILYKLGLLNVHTEFEILNPLLDLTAGIHPFVQMTRNPHFSLPHGTFLFTFACMALGERTRRAKWYGMAALFAFVHGLCRPYDLISLFAILPAFVLLECALARHIEWRWCIVRCAPLALAAPLLLYNVYLFSFHPVFKFWASQGGHPANIPIRWHLLSLGIPLLLFVARLLRARAHPIATPAERLILVWGVTLVVLFHAYRVFSFMPYTPQLVIPSVTPLIILGVSLLPALETLHASQRRLLIVSAAVLVCATSLSTPIYIRRESSLVTHNELHFIRTEDLDAIAWLNGHIRESDIVLARYPYSSRMSQYLNARVSVGHWALSPHVNDLRPRIDRFLDGSAAPEEARLLLDEIRPRYVYLNRENSAPPPQYFQSNPDLKPVFENGGVAIFEAPKSD